MRLRAKEIARQDRDFFTVTNLIAKEIMAVKDALKIGRPEVEAPLR